MDENEVRDARDASDVWDVGENSVVTSPGSIHLYTHTLMSTLYTQ